MAYTAQKLLEIAIKELGYKEKASNSQLDSKEANAGNKNWTKYARDLHTAGYYQAAKNGYAWCDMFVDWCFLQLGGNKTKGEWLECQTGLYGAGCTWSSDCYRWADRWGTEPKVGAQIFFAKNGKGSEEHTGIVEKFDKNYVYTIEGNASNMVKRKTYNRTSTYILGYGYPRFDEESTTPTKSEIASDYFAKNDVVTVVSGSNWLSGKTVPSWVIKKEWLVKSASTTDGRVVIDKSVDGSNSICSPIHCSCLILVKKAGTQADKQEAEFDGSQTTPSKEVFTGTPSTGSEANIKRMWDFLKSKGLSDYAVAGIMGNIYAESSFRSNNLQGSYEKKLGYTDDSYTQSVDNGSYTNFIKDSAGYGLAQWTYYSRKEDLLVFATNKKKSIGDFEMQLEFLWDELQDYKSMMKQLKEATSVKEASDLILHDFEAPADQSAAVEEKRAGYGQKYFDKYAECKHTTTEVVNSKAATCSVAGYTGDTKCSKCGKIVNEGELVPTIPHVYELKDAVDATYNQSGYTGNKVCKVCGHIESGVPTDKIELPSLEETETDESIDISISKNWLVKFIKWLLDLLRNNL